jgi:hypothetical protein
MVKSSRTESSLFELFRKNSYVTTCSLTWKNIKKLEEGFCIETFYFSGSFQNKGKIFFFSFLEEKSVPSIISNSAFTGFLTDFFNSDPFSKFSKKMLKCSAVHRLFFQNFFK